MADAGIHPLFDRVARRFCRDLSNHVGDGVCYVDKDLRILLWNQAAEQATGLNQTEVTGKSWREDIRMHLGPEKPGPGPHACPVEQTIREGKIRIVDVFLPHKDGYRIPVHLRILPVSDDKNNIIGAAAVFTPTTPLIMVPMGQIHLEHSGFLDAGLGVPNRKFLEMILRKRLEEYKKFGLSFGLLFIDMDHFTKFEEKHGRFNSTKILKIIAGTLQKNVRYLDVMGVWEKDQFLVLLHNIEENRLDIVANKLRLMVAESYLLTETVTLNATVSIGACLVQRYDTPESLVSRAQKLMMHSKWRGRNKVSLSLSQKDFW